jgi:predicted nucleotidyltransferase
MFEVARYENSIKALCQKYAVKRFEIFGSAAGDAFAPDSDVDCLIEFIEDGGNYFDRFFALKYDLEKLFRRPVDLLVKSAIRNPYFRESVENTKISVYVA